MHVFHDYSQLEWGFPCFFPLWLSLQLWMGYANREPLGSHVIQGSSSQWEGLTREGQWRPGIVWNLDMLDGFRYNVYIIIYHYISIYIYTHKSSKYVYVILHYWTYSILFVSLMCHMLDDRQGPSLDISGVTVVRWSRTSPGTWLDHTRSMLESGGIPGHGRIWPGIVGSSV